MDFHPCHVLVARGFSRVDFPRCAKVRQFLGLPLISGLESKEIRSSNSLRINVKLKARSGEARFGPLIHSLDTHLLIYLWVLNEGGNTVERHSGGLNEKARGAYANDY